MFYSILKFAILSLVGLTFTACLQEQHSDDSINAELLEQENALPWSEDDSPYIFSRQLEVRLAQLPREGAAKVSPWPASYWPNYQDSINYKWDGVSSLSASAKYGKAFNVRGVEDSVSRSSGIYSVDYVGPAYSAGKACQEDTDCTRFNPETRLEELTGDASCAKRNNAAVGRCVPTWYGLCHAWAPASILVPEPKYPVEKNGVTFKVNDIKALITIAHNQTSGPFTSGRCEGEKDFIEYDEYDRPKNPECIDTNPATVHILLTNYLGLKQESFIMDRTFDSQVWNQPLRSFNVDMLRDIDAQRANALVGKYNDGTYAFNNNAHSFYEVVTRVMWIAESESSEDGPLLSDISRFTHTDRLHYVLELNANGQLIGGEWVGESKKAHPDFLWIPKTVHKENIAEGKIKFQEVMELAQASLTPSNTISTPTDNTPVVTDPQTSSVAPRAFHLTESLDQNYGQVMGPFKSRREIDSVFKISGQGDLGLFVKNGASATWENFDCVQYLDTVTGNTNFANCTMYGSGDFYVLVYGYGTGSFQFDAQWTGEVYTKGSKKLYYTEIN